MKLRSTKREELSVNLTPLIDVVFLLLIFFMVSTSFNRESEIIVDLPEASNDQAQVAAEAIEITIDSDGLYYVNNQQLINTQIATLKAAISQVADNKTDVPLIIMADGHAPHQAVVTAMDAARQLGIVHLSIATKQKK